MSAVKPGHAIGYHFFNEEGTRYGIYAVSDRRTMAPCRWLPKTWSGASRRKGSWSA
jgi:hypothetical protein